MKKENYYRLTKKELSFVNYIQSPFVSRFGRLSRPVVLVRLSANSSYIQYVWSLSWFKHKVKSNTLPHTYYIEIRASY